MNTRPMLVGAALLLAAGCTTGAPDGTHRDAAGRLLAQLQQTPYDPADHEATWKVWHHLYSPTGTLLTKGPGGKFPHHRGLYVGWNQIRVGAAKYDIWHGTAQCSQRWREQLKPAEHDLGAGWQVHAIDWCDATGKPFVHERRGLCIEPLGPTAYLLRMDVALRAANERVLLRGDPQHAGIQFRALQQFAEPGAEAVRYLRPPTAKDQQNDVWTDCAWTAAVLPLTGGPVTVLRLETAGNPNATWATRDYGRFGAMYDLDLDPDRLQRLRVDWIIAEGERDAAWCEQMAAARQR